MTKLLEKAFKKASLLSSVEQNGLAKWMIEEIESEKQWMKLLLIRRIFSTGLLMKL